MAELKALAWTSIVLLALPPISVAGMNPDIKLAMHVIASADSLGWEDLTPAACESINVDVSVADLFEAETYGNIALLAEEEQDTAASEAGTLRIARVIEITDGSVYCIDPSWSPDGSKVVFSHSQYQGIYLADADGEGPVVELTDPPYSGYSRQWTADGRALIFRARTGKRGHAIRAIDVETKEVRDLVTGLRSVGPLQRNKRGDIFMKADGHWMAVDERAGQLVEPQEYYLARGGSGADAKMIEWKPTSTVWIINSDGSNRVRFPHQAGSPSLSPTGDKICFHWADLCVANLDGTGVVVLADEGYADAECWSPDGREIVFTVASDEDHWGNFNWSELFVAKVDGSGTTQLTSTPDIRECLPSWSPDGRRIAYGDARTGRIFVAVLERVQ